MEHASSNEAFVVLRSDLPFSILKFQNEKVPTQSGCTDSVGRSRLSRDFPTQSGFPDLFEHTTELDTVLCISNSFYELFVALRPVFFGIVQFSGGAF